MRREEAGHLYEHSFSDHTFRVTGIVTGYGGGNAIIVSASEDRTCKFPFAFILVDSYICYIVMVSVVKMVGLQQ